MTSPAVLLLLLPLLSVGVLAGPPVIDVGEEYVQNISLPFILKCYGDKEVDWDWDTSVQIDDVSISPSLPDSDPPFLSIFQVTGQLYIEDTGYYHCHYVEDKDQMTSTYVYVDDNQYDFVNPENPMFLNGFTDTALVIDCRTTTPTTTVKLYKDGIEVNPNEGSHRFDPRRGFVETSPTVQMSGNYQCKIDQNDNTKDLIIRITAAAEQKLLKPTISPDPTSHFVVGHPFTLACTVASVHPITFTWTKPDLTGPSPELVQGNGDDMTRRSELVVDSATTSDSGRYMCAIAASGFDSNEDTYVVNIETSLVPYVNVTTTIHVIIVNVSAPLKWKSHVMAFPDQPVLTFYNPSGREVHSTDRIKTAKHADGTAWLILTHTLREDFGNWTLKAESEDGQLQDVTFTTIVVKSPPAVKVLPPTLVPPGTQGTIACLITAWPRPELEDIHWTIDGEEIKPLESERTTAKNLVTVRAVFSFNSTTTISCSARNNNGQGSSSALVVVTDLSERWLLQHKGLNQRVTHGGPAPSSVVALQVVENDPFFLECGAASDLYSDVQLSMPDGITASNRSTLFSVTWSTDSSSNVATQQHAGRYSCSVRNISSSDTYTRSMDITVKPEKEPELLATDGAIFGEDMKIPVRVGHTYVVDCRADEDPKSTVTWMKDGDLIVFGNTTLLLEEQGQQVKIPVFRPEDAGTYTCTRIWRSREYTVSRSLYHAQVMSTTSKVFLIMAVSFIVVLVLAAIYLVRRLRREKAKSDEHKKNQKFLFQEGNLNQLNMDLTAEEQAEMLPYDKSFEVDRDRITIGRQLGSGAFGRVVKAQVVGLRDDEESTPVAVKMCKSVSDPSHLRNLAIELKIMIHLGKHLNIVNLLGANTSDIVKGELWLLVEYCKYGDLLSFLHRYRRRFVNQIDPLTDSINYNILTVTPRSAASPLSPGANTNRQSSNSAGTGSDGYLIPNKATEPLILANPPKGRPLSRNAQQPPTSPTSPGSSSFFAGNPGYGLMSEMALAEVPAEGGQYGGGAGGLATLPESPTPAAAAATRTDLPDQQQHIPTTTNNTDSPYANLSNSGGAPGTPGPQSPPPYVQHGHPTGGRQRASSRSTTGGSISRDSNPYIRGSSQGSLRHVNTDMTTLTSTYNPRSPDAYLDSQGNPMQQDGTSIPGLSCPFTTTELVCWAWQVAQGMEYLAKRKVLHGDLAARNLLLAEGNVIKISDFGLSRDIYKKEIYTKQGDDLLPIKWMSIEAIRDRMFSTESDIWAYGIVLWEMFSLGQAPYPGMDVNPQFLDDLEAGMRNRQPKYSNTEIYRLMLDCWLEEPEDRPRFSLIRKRLDDMLKDDIKDNFVTMNDSYVRMNHDYFAERTDYLAMFTSPDFNNIQKSADDQKSLNMEDMNDEAARNYVNMTRCLPSEDAPPEARYLPMQVVAGSPPAQPDHVFSPNPVDPRLSKFEFHSEEDMPSRQSEDDNEEDEEATSPAPASSPAARLLQAEQPPAFSAPVAGGDTKDDDLHEDNRHLLAQQGKSSNSSENNYLNMPARNAPVAAAADSHYLNFKV